MDHGQNPEGATDTLSQAAVVPDWRELDRAFVEEAKMFVKKYGKHGAKLAGFKAFEENGAVYYGDYIDAAVKEIETGVIQSPFSRPKRKQ